MPAIHNFPGLTSEEVLRHLYRGNSLIEDGDILVVPANVVEEHEGLVAVLVEADFECLWPVVVHGGNEDGSDHEFDVLDQYGDLAAWQGEPVVLGDSDRYRASFELALRTTAPVRPTVRCLRDQRAWRG
jgi:hypothetical protein